MADGDISHTTSLFPDVAQSYTGGSYKSAAKTDVNFTLGNVAEAAPKAEPRFMTQTASAASPVPPSKDGGYRAHAVALNNSSRPT